MSPEERARELLPILIARAASSQDEQCINLLAAAIRAAVAEEREACALVADEQARHSSDWGAAARVIADNIRFRGKAPP